MKVLFLDIDGVLQSGNLQDRFDHLKAADLRKMAEELNERVKDRGDYDYVERLRHAVMNERYDFTAVYYDWDKRAVAFLHRILEETGAKIVLSSDWREQGDRDMQALLGIHDLKKYWLDSTWTVGYRWGLKGYSELWRKCGEFFMDDAQRKEFGKVCPPHIYKDWSGQTVTSSFVDERSLEIREWLDRHPEVTNYVALDDRTLEVGLNGHFVHVGGWIREEDYKRAVEILNGPDDGPYAWPLADREPLEQWRREWLNRPFNPEYNEPVAGETDLLDPANDRKPW